MKLTLGIGRWTVKLPLRWIIRHRLSSRQRSRHVDHERGPGRSLSWAACPQHNFYQLHGAIRAYDFCQRQSVYRDDQHGLSAPTLYQGIAPLQPILQRADGSYIGTASLSTGTNFPWLLSPRPGNCCGMVPTTHRRSRRRTTAWIGASGTTYDQDGNVDGQVSMTTQSWAGNSYQVGSVDQIASNLINLAGSFWPQLGANASGNSAAVIQEKLYVRSFAPWYSFGPDPYSNKYPWNVLPCGFDCFLGDNRTFTTAVGPGVTSRINGSVRLLFPDMQPILAQAYSNLTTAIYRLPPGNTGTANPTTIVIHPPADDALDLPGKEAALLGSDCTKH